MGCFFSTQTGHATRAHSPHEVSNQNTCEIHTFVHEINALKNEVAAVRTHLERASADFIGQQELFQLQQRAFQLDHDIQANQQTRNPSQTKEFCDRLESIKSYFLALSRPVNESSFRFDTTIHADACEASARFFDYPL